MNKKIKVLLVVLGIFSLLSAGLAGWIHFSVQAKLSGYAQKEAEFTQQQTKFKKQIAFLRKKLSLAPKETEKWQGKFESVNTSLNKLNKDYALIQSQYASLLKEKDTLVAENAGLSEQLEKISQLYAQKQEPVQMDTSDRFLAALLEEKASLQVRIERLEDELQSLARQTRPAQERLARLEKEKEIFERKLEDIEKVTDILSDDLLQEKRKAMALEESLIQAEGQLQEIIVEKDQLSTQLTNINLALEKRLEELEKTKQVLEGAIKDTRRLTRKTRPVSVQLSPIVVKAEHPAPLLELEEKEDALESEELITELEEEIFEFGPAGRIITVNDKYSFVVIDLGRSDGLAQGMIFDVWRQDKEVGKIEVIETRKNIAACDIKEMNVKQFQINDIVRWSLSY